MQTVQIITLLATVLTAGWVSAYVTQLIKRERWASSVKLILALVVAVLVALATAWLSGDVTRFITLWKGGGITAGEVLTFAALIFASAQTWYHFYFPTQAWAQKIGALGSK